jgi:hypothetical protein
MPQDRVRDSESGRSLFLRAAVGLAVTIAVVCANGAVRAGDDDEDGASVIDRLMASVGLKRENHAWDGINYSERSPLVVPPTRDLPTPVNGSAPPVPNWPKDADIAAKKVKKDDRPRYQRNPDADFGSQLRPDQLGPAGGGDRVESPTSSADAGLADPRGTVVDVRDQGAKKSLFSNIFSKQQYATFTGEPVRETLTDPPPGYLTPSPDQPYGIGYKAQPYKTQTVGDRMEPTR